MMFSRSYRSRAFVCGLQRCKPAADFVCPIIGGAISISIHSGHAIHRACLSGEGHAVRNKPLTNAGKLSQFPGWNIDPEVCGSNPCPLLEAREGQAKQPVELLEVRRLLHIWERPDYQPAHFCDIADLDIPVPLARSFCLIPRAAIATRIFLATITSHCDTPCSCTTQKNG